MNPFPPNETRQALSSGLPGNDDAASIPTRAVAFTSLPPSHARALDPDAILVEGIRGAGKSFWWSALHSDKHRAFIATAFPEASAVARLRTSQGFGTGLDPAVAPSKDVLAHLAAKHDPRSIWRAVVATHLEFSSPFPTINWDQRVSWVAQNPEMYDHLLYNKDLELASRGQTHIVLFDALDRLADDWPGIRPLARALLQLALDLRSLRMVRLKLFVRPDMLEDPGISSFPDASKLLSRKASLAWRRADLYALLYQCLGNAPQGGEAFRSHCDSAFGLKWKLNAESDAWVVPNALRLDEEKQKDVFHAITGPTMGSGPSGHKRGYPYTWLPNHLLDGREQVSPRSFAAALRYAAAADIPEDWQYALSYRGIQAGVQEASRIRVDEIREDYPWVDDVMKPLHGKLTVPCSEEEMVSTWKPDDTIGSLREQVSGSPTVKLPPQHIDDGPRGILRDLAALGVVMLMSDGRIQMPDVYRVAFGLGRRGGVRPLK